MCCGVRAVRAPRPGLVFSTCGRGCSRALAWPTAAEKRSRYSRKRLAACLVLRELARHAPTLFYARVCVKSNFALRRRRHVLVAIPRHRRDVVPVIASARMAWRSTDNLTHWLISTQPGRDFFERPAVVYVSHPDVRDAAASALAAALELVAARPAFNSGYYSPSTETHRQ